MLLSFSIIFSAYKTKESGKSVSVNQFQVKDVIWKANLGWKTPEILMPPILLVIYESLICTKLLISHLVQVPKSRSGSPSHPHAEHRGFLWEIGGYVAIYRPTVQIMTKVFFQALYYRIDYCVFLQDQLLCSLTGSNVVYALIIHDYVEKQLKSLEQLD